MGGLLQNISSIFFDKKKRQRAECRVCIVMGIRFFLKDAGCDVAMNGFHVCFC